MSYRWITVSRPSRHCQRPMPPGQRHCKDLQAKGHHERHITLISAHNDVLSLFIYDPLEAALPDAGRLVMAEGELQTEVDTSDRALRERYPREFEQRLARIHELSRQRQIPVLPLSTAEPVQAQLRALLGARQRGRRP
jgi:uncharacterized protein (DUF58 family)